MITEKRIAIVCDWLTSRGGAEKVIFGLHRLFPNAPIYTSVFNAEKFPELKNAKVITSFLQNAPLAQTKHQFYLKWFPKAFESFDFSNFDIVISSAHSCAKGIITNPGTTHFSYCHSPMRYAWENSQSYINQYETNFFLKKIAPFFIHNIRIWDRQSADRVDHFIANSNHVKKRIKKYYRRDASVIYPFINFEEYHPNYEERDNYYLAGGRLTAYKRFDLIVEAFNENGLPLKIFGEGSMLKKLRSIAKSNIELLGYVNNSELTHHYQKAKALIFPQIEDFGIMPLEAMANGCPVLAYGEGGATESIVDGISGYFFNEQSHRGINQAIQKLQSRPLNTKKIVEQAQKFDYANFKDQILQLINIA